MRVRRPARCRKSSVSCFRGHAGTKCWCRERQGRGSCRGATRCPDAPRRAIPRHRCSSEWACWRVYAIGFSVLILRDTSRFSRRDGDEAFAELKAIARAGVQIYFYADGTQFEYGTLATNVVGFIRSEMAADYRRQIAAWTAEAMLQKAKAGHVTGGLSTVMTTSP